MSRSAQVVVMMVCWWVVVATRPCSLLAGLFVVEGSVGGDVVASEGIILFWVLAFLVQVAILMLAGRAGRAHQRRGGSSWARCCRGW